MANFSVDEGHQALIAHAEGLASTSLMPEMPTVSLFSAIVHSEVRRKTTKKHLATNR